MPLPIEPKIVFKDGFLIAGLEYRGNNQNFDVPKLWNRLIEKAEAIKTE